MWGLLAKENSVPFLNMMLGFEFARSMTKEDQAVPEGCCVRGIDKNVAARRKIRA